MLIEEQIKKLEALMSKYKIWKNSPRCLETWKNSQPCQKTFGVYVPNDNDSIFAMVDTKYCCLIGAAGYTKTPFHTLLKTIMKEYLIDDVEEIWAISDGFDCKEERDSQNYKKAYEFGRNVAEIVKPILFTSL